MNVIANQDLMEVPGRGSILVHLQQLRTVVSWVRQATLHLYPSMGFFDFNFFVTFKRPYHFYVTRFHNFI